MIKRDFVEPYGKYRYKVYVTEPTGKTHHLFTSEWYHNLITNAGRTWMINRWANNSMDFVKAIAVGTGVTNPALTQTALVTETARQTTTNTPFGTPTWQTKFNAVMAASQVNGTTEIGVFDSATTGNLLARNIHTALSVPPGSSISFDYVFGLYTSKTATGWTKTAGKSYTYEIADYVGVISVIEVDTQNGYAKKTSTTTVDGAAGSYWHDGGANKTYIHCTDNADPSTHSIVVLSSAT